MVMCFIPGCEHYSEGKTCKLFVFPVNPAERRKWINLIRRKDREPSKHSLVCSCHFIDMDRKNRPTIFEFNSKRKVDFENPEKRYVDLYYSFKQYRKYFGLEPRTGLCTDCYEVYKAQNLE